MMRHMSISACYDKPAYCRLPEDKSPKQPEPEEYDCQNNGLDCEHLVETYPSIWRYKDETKFTAVYQPPAPKYIPEQCLQISVEKNGTFGMQSVNMTNCSQAPMCSSFDSYNSIKSGQLTKELTKDLICKIHATNTEN